MPCVRFETGPLTGEKIPLDKEKTTFGRSRSCDCVLSHPTVSREHFYVELNNGKLFLVDQGSENGTHVNTERVSWIELKNGDTIRAGPFVLVFEVTGASTGVTAMSATDEQRILKTEAGSSEISTTGLYAPQYLEGIEHFNAGRYFDAHEVWEEIWLRSSEETKLFYQMLIQAAVGLHHYERGNKRGARGMHKNVMEKLNRLPSIFMSLDLDAFAADFKAYLKELIEADIEADSEAAGEASVEADNEALPSSDKPRPQIHLLFDSTE